MQALLLCAAVQTNLTAGLCQCIVALKICYTERCAITTAAQFKAHCMPCCSVFLCQNKLIAVLCHYNYTYAGFALHTGVHHKPKMQCSKVRGKGHALFLYVAVPKQADTRFVPLQSHLLRLAIHTIVELPNSIALQHCSGQDACLDVLCC